MVSKLCFCSVFFICLFFGFFFVCVYVTVFTGHIPRRRMPRLNSICTFKMLSDIVKLLSSRGCIEVHSQEQCMKMGAGSTPWGIWNVGR